VITFSEAIWLRRLPDDIRPNGKPLAENTQKVYHQGFARAVRVLGDSPLSSIDNVKVRASGRAEENYGRERRHRRAEIAAARYAALPPVIHQSCRARSQSPAPSALPDFVQDVEAALLNLEYSKKEAKQAVRRASGGDFSTRLKNALAVLRTPDSGEVERMNRRTKSIAVVRITRGGLINESTSGNYR
jgi:RuvA, C-terminal domain